jgi:methylmalonyl-CoA mutase C-terminal domain/subunit
MTAAPALRPLAGKRILVAKPGLDGHDAGAKVAALALRDAGAEVIYTGLRRSVEYIVRAAVDEDVHAVGLSILSGSHTALTREVIEALHRAGAGDIAVFVGGTIPPEDRVALVDAGALAVFTADMPLDAVIGELATKLASVARDRIAE